MFAETSCVNIFPIPIWAHALKPEDAERVNRAALDLVETIRAETPGLKPREHWQTANNLQARPELADLMGLVAEATTGVLQRLKLEYGSFLISGCWANIMPGGGLPHRSHTHPNNFLSGVYYVQAPRVATASCSRIPNPRTTSSRPGCSSRTSTIRVTPPSRFAPGR